MEYKSIATVELISVARGYDVADKMIKAADVKLLAARTLCPGKFIIIVGGNVGAVKSALSVGTMAGGDSVSDSMYIPNIHPSVFPALLCATECSSVRDLGFVETLSAPSAIEAADAAAKSSNVKIMEIRIGQGMGTKAFFSFTGEISDIKSAIKAARAIVEPKGLLVEAVAISGPHKDLKNELR